MGLCEVQILWKWKEIIRRGNLQVHPDYDEFEQHYLDQLLVQRHDIKFMLGYEMNDIIDGGITEDEAGGFRARMNSFLEHFRKQFDYHKP